MEITTQTIQINYDDDIDDIDNIDNIDSINNINNINSSNNISMSYNCNLKLTEKDFMDINILNNKLFNIYNLHGKYIIDLRDETILSKYFPNITNDIFFKLADLIYTKSFDDDMNSTYAKFIGFFCVTYMRKILEINNKYDETLIWNKINIFDIDDERVYEIFFEILSGKKIKDSLYYNSSYNHYNAIKITNLKI